jgi:hypothetical protein
MPFGDGSWPRADRQRDLCRFENYRKQQLYADRLGSNVLWQVKYQDFDGKGRVKRSSYSEHLVNVMEELVKFTLIVRDRLDN